MKIEFCRDSGGSYMIFKRKGRDDFRERMLTGNNIPGLLPVSIRNINGESYYYYDVRSKITIDSFSSLKELSGEEMKIILGGLAQINDTLADFLLTGDRLVIDPEAIMINPQNCTPYFCLYPEGEASKEDYLKLAELFIGRINNDDEAAVSLAYGFYEQVAAGQFNPRDLIKEEMKRESDENKLSTEEIFGVEAAFEPDENYYFREVTYVDEEDDSRHILMPMCICAVVILVSGVGYITVFLNNDILSLLGISRESYIVVGAAMAGVLAVLLVLILQLYIRRKEKREQQAAEEKKNADQMPINTGKMELEEYAESQANGAYAPDEDTVLLIADERSTVNGKVRRLVGKAEENSIDIEIIKTPFVIGKLREKVDGVIEIDGISRIHARIVLEGDRYFIEDLNSTNGTYLNMRQLERGERAEIEVGDVIKLAGAVLTFVDT